MILNKPENMKHCNCEIYILLNNLHPAGKTIGFKAASNVHKKCAQDCINIVFLFHSLKGLTVTELKMDKLSRTYKLIFKLNEHRENLRGFCDHMLIRDLKFLV